ncbi:UDP-2,3-diacylglucosamine diphosphatase [Candidimonas nitroreducens]|uniref:UDP-2,3-diacylglucosamine hydrolase n=1 Tax=Candidimonas nitroreducens TaxID=683354 RepID=A0A225MKS1_9BURK|nr:UDP-2,3-diacylglucosamine diphosphatase [Candidimonas nitroreducens]OWT60121.1 UDP-2,3-diacylglucosamine diphosphatase [Candidimonas nitroreducens]
MDKLRIPGRIWLASDIHLGPDVPATCAAFLDFLGRARGQADALLLCGDIFDAWIGDDLAVLEPAAWLAPILQRLRELAQDTPLWLGRGNRDFLMGRTLAGHLGARLLPDTARLDTDCGAVLLSHGDEYCTEDHAYQRFRRIVRNPTVQRLFLALGRGTRRAIARWARARSMSANRSKHSRIMDVSPQAVAAAYARSGVDLMVHGHTHRPAVHRIEVGARMRTRIVLPDWECDHARPPRGGWLVIDREGPRLYGLSGEPIAG